MDTYKIGSERLSSESTMHCEAKGLSGEELQKVKSELKEGHEQERIQEFSYQTLRRIYFQRRTHRLPEWKEFCKWIETLPLSNELITIGVEKKMRVSKNGKISKDIELDWKKVMKKPIPIDAVEILEEFEVETIEGVMKGKKGDWLMKGVNGEFYPCDKEIFEKTYDILN
jgi:hypothetical protein